MDCKLNDVETQETHWQSCVSVHSAISVLPIDKFRTIAYVCLDGAQNNDSSGRRCTDRVWLRPIYTMEEFQKPYGETKGGVRHFVRKKCEKMSFCSTRPL